MNRNTLGNQQWYPNHPAQYPPMNCMPPFIPGFNQEHTELLQNNIPQSTTNASTQENSGAAPTIINHYHIFYGAPFPGAYGQSWCETQQANGNTYTRSAENPAWQPIVNGAQIPGGPMFHGPPVPPLVPPLASSGYIPTRELSSTDAIEGETLTTRQFTVKRERSMSEETESFSTKQISVKKEPCDFVKEGRTSIKKKRCSNAPKENMSIQAFSPEELWQDSNVGNESLSSLDGDIGNDDKKEPSILASRKNITKLKPYIKRTIQKPVLKVAPRINKATVTTTETVGKARVLEALQKSRSEYRSCKMPYQNFIDAYKALYNVDFTQEERAKYFGINNAKPVFIKYCSHLVAPYFVADDQYLICNDNCSVHLYHRTDLIEIAAKVLDLLVKSYPNKCKMEKLVREIKKISGLDFERYNISWQHFINDYLNGQVMIGPYEDVLLTREEIAFRGLDVRRSSVNNGRSKKRYQKDYNNYTGRHSSEWNRP